MKLYTLDFETYYDRTYSLSKMSIESYVRNPLFKAHGCSIKIDDQPTHWYSADDLDLILPSLDLPNNAVLAHHSQFDGLILSHHYGITPKRWYDTLSMARAVVGVETRVGLSALALHFGIGRKNEGALQTVLGKRVLTAQEEAELAKYCINDVELTYALFNILALGFQTSELQLIDKVIRLFTEPILKLDYSLLKDYLEEIQAAKLCMLLESGLDRADLMSNPKFAAVLEGVGVTPPKKLSPRTCKPTYAFAKTDPQMQALLEHPDPKVAMLVATRLGIKSTIDETRTEAFMNMALRGPAPVYLKYSGAKQTHRLSGGDSTNFQNLRRGSKLRDSVMAPPGFVLVVVDSANIEARILDYLADEKEELEAYRLYDAGLGPDIYCVMAEKIYNRPIDKKENPDERFLGKVAKLGLGYGMGAIKFLTTALQFKVPGITPELAQLAVSVYRNKQVNVLNLWAKANVALRYAASGSDTCDIDCRGILSTQKNAILLPNGLKISYPNLTYSISGGVDGWTFTSVGDAIKIYGGKVIENCVQALARIVVMEQTVRLAKKWRLVMSVHDEAVFCVPENRAQECIDDCLKVFRTPPAWATDLPLNATADAAHRYGDAK